MKIEKRHEHSDPITYSSFWWIPLWGYAINKISSSSVEYELLILAYLIVSFLVWFNYFFTAIKEIRKKSYI
jgi:hypothetical protein